MSFVRSTSPTDPSTSITSSRSLSCSPTLGSSGIIWPAVAGPNIDIDAELISCFNAWSSANFMLYASKRSDLHFWNSSACWCTFCVVASTKAFHSRSNFVTLSAAEVTCVLSLVRRLRCPCVSAFDAAAACCLAISFCCCCSICSVRSIPALFNPLRCSKIFSSSGDKVSAAACDEAGWITDWSTSDSLAPTPSDWSVFLFTALPEGVEGIHGAFPGKTLQSFAPSSETLFCSGFPVRGCFCTFAARSALWSLPSLRPMHTAAPAKLLFLSIVHLALPAVPRHLQRLSYTGRNFVYLKRMMTCQPKYFLSQFFASSLSQKSRCWSPDETPAQLALLPQLSVPPRFSELHQRP